ncbi:MAG: sn-glycerol-3-phosphate ABC transporter ATP-binding protein UgpC [Boseongicola sp.]|nr:sn-glycerol-3-phosphate ABC transporter ATP-binding protein UgpC [Boseongicola sp.]
MTDIQFSSVVKRYGALEVVKNLDLEIEEGEFMVLVGPSGCGKSTSLRMIAGLESVSAGELSIGGRVVNDVLPKDRDVSMVFQSYALYPHMTVRENIAFGLELRRRPKDEIRRLVDDAADMLGLERVLDRKPKALSGGQRQRVALGRAIVRQPSVFLFDEPLSNLDAELRVHMRAEISRLQQQTGVTTVYVTHDQTEAMTMGNRIAVFANGIMQQVGAPVELYTNPRNVFVARFIGTPSMNMIRLRVSEDGGRLSGEGIDLALDAERKAQLAGYRNREVCMGVRCEQLSEPSGISGEAASMTGKIEIVETLGHEVIAHVRVGREIVQVRLSGLRTDLRAGAQITVHLDCSDMLFFDPDTELRV